MTVNKRTKKRIDKYLSKMREHFPEEVAEIQGLFEHYEGIISDFQNVTGRLHPTLTGTFEAVKPGQDEGF